MVKQNDIATQTRPTKDDPILIIEQQTAIAVTQYDTNIISGDFSSINWQQLQGISISIISTISSAGIIEEEMLEARQTLLRDPTSKTISPCIHIYCPRPLSKTEKNTIRSLCLYQSSHMLQAPSRCTCTDDMFNDRAAIDLTDYQREAAENGARTAAAAVGAKLTHPIAIIDGQKSKISELAGKVQKHQKSLVTPTANRIVNAIIDLLSYSQFSLKLITEDGEVVTGNYENHEDFPLLAERLKNRDIYRYSLAETIADNGRSMISISLAD